jgi:hypothetical protein
MFGFGACGLYRIRTQWSSRSCGGRTNAPLAVLAVLAFFGDDAQGNRFPGPSRPAGPADYSADQSNAGAPPVATAHRPVLSVEQYMSSNHIVTRLVDYFY